MTQMRTVLLLALGLPVMACKSSPATVPTETDTDTDADTDADTDTDTDSDTDTDTDADTDTDTDTDSDTDTDTDTDTDDPCANPTALDGGFVMCADGRINRPTQGGVSAVTLATCAGTEGTLDCTQDSDCTAEPNGQCLHQNASGGALPTDDSCVCTYHCTSDADCNTGEVCLPGSLIQHVDVGLAYPQCVPAQCTTDADCGAGGECGLSNWTDGCSDAQQLSCRTPTDTCVADSDCTSTGGWCGSNGGTDFTCSDYICAIGRPLLVDGEIRVAALVDRGDWSAAFDLPHDDELAAHWARNGALEHASVASFAAVTLQLMALGAPPEILADTQQAAADEVEHARLCFGLASAYGGARVGPGPLALDGVSLHADPSAVLSELIAEACIAETLASLQAAAEAEACEEPVVKAVLTRIAADEQRHAALGWRTLAWMLEAFPALRAEALEQLRTHADRVARVESDGASGREAEGVLAGATRSELRRRASREVLSPVIAALAA